MEKVSSRKVRFPSFTSFLRRAHNSSAQQTVPPEHVPLVASLAHFAAAGQPDLSSEELANRLETGLRGWDAGLGSHKERIKELRSELAEYRQTSDKKFVDVSEVSEACAEQASISFPCQLL